MERNFNTHLYFIRDRLSKAPLTSVIQSLNDLSSARGFKAFLEANKRNSEEKNEPVIGEKEFELIHICCLNQDNKIIPSNDDFDENSYRKVCSGDTVDDLINDLISKIDESED